MVEPTPLRSDDRDSFGVCGGITNINKEVIFHKMVFESLNLGPGAPNSACGSTAKKVTVSRLRFAIAFPSREYDPENMLFGAISPLRASKLMASGWCRL